MHVDALFGPSAREKGRESLAYNKVHYGRQPEKEKGVPQDPVSKALRRWQRQVFLDRQRVYVTTASTGKVPCAGMM